MLEKKTEYLILSIAKINILGTSEELPLPVFGDLPYPEETRLKYRFLDLRRHGLHKNIILRSKIIEFIRREMWEIGFNEFRVKIKNVDPRWQ